MTASTRSRLMMCLVLGLITLPAEALLFPVARTPNPAVAAAEWTASLDPAELHDAAANIDAYPSPYRRAIMSALAPADRADAWRTYFRGYIASHPSLTADQVSALDESIAVIAPDAFKVPAPADLRDRIGKAFAHVQKALGVPAATELFVTLGPLAISSGRGGSCRLPRTTTRSTATATSTSTRATSSRIRGSSAPSSTPVNST